MQWNAGRAVWMNKDGRLFITKGCIWDTVISYMRQLDFHSQNITWDTVKARFDGILEDDVRTICRVWSKHGAQLDRNNESQLTIYAGTHLPGKQPSATPGHAVNDGSTEDDDEPSDSDEATKDHDDDDDDDNDNGLSRNDEATKDDDDDDDDYGLSRNDEYAKDNDDDDDNESLRNKKSLSGGEREDESSQDTDDKHISLLNKMSFQPKERPQSDDPPQFNKSFPNHGSFPTEDLTEFNRSHQTDETPEDNKLLEANQPSQVVASLQAKDRGDQSILKCVLIPPKRPMTNTHTLSVANEGWGTASGKTRGSTPLSLVSSEEVFRIVEYQLTAEMDQMQKSRRQF